MGVKLKGGINDVISVFDKAEEIMVEEITKALAYVGEECLTQIREKTPEEGSWHDRTGNLRSSIGYAVMDHGADVIKSAFASVSGPDGTGGNGAKIGERYIHELASQYSSVYALVVVAGMNYAEYVEARGIDVLSGAKLYAEKRIQTVLEVYMKRAQKRINALLKV